MNIVFFGHDKMVIPVLEQIKKQAELVAIVLPNNRKMTQIKPVEQFAKAKEIPCFKPNNPASQNFIQNIKRLKPDLAVVYNYSRIFKKGTINVFPLGMINLHGALLPQYRGANVINWTLINGETETGVTAHFINEKIDAGPIVGQIKYKIGPNDTANDIKIKLKKCAPVLLKKVLNGLKKGNLKTRFQNNLGKWKKYPPRKPDGGKIDFSKSAQEIRNLIRALVLPWPGAFCFYNGDKIIIESAKVLKGKSKPGVVVKANPSLIIGTGDNLLKIEETRIDNKIVKPSIKIIEGLVFK